MEFGNAKSKTTDQLRRTAIDLFSPAIRAPSRSAIRNDGRMGIGLRLCQGYFVLVFLCALSYALITAPANFAYDFSMVHGMAVSAASLVIV